MFTNLLRQLTAPAPTRLPAPDARLALAALMVRIARVDHQYSSKEMARIDRILSHNHMLSLPDAAKLRAEAELLESSAPDTVRFTRALKSATALEDRTALVQSLWSVALADGQRDADEDQMMRLLTNLLGLSDVESALARRKAESA